jgi:hypothetical protein
MKSFLFSALLLVSVAFAGEVTKNFDYKDFSEVNVGYGMKVEITQSNAYSIEVQADERDFKYLKVEKEGDNLRFYINERNYRKADDINIKITMPSLEAIGLSGGSIGNIDMDISTKNFDCDLSGGSILKGKLNCGDLDLDLSGGSQATLKGKGGNAEIDGSGGSIFKLKDFSVNNAEISLSGGSQVSVNINETLNASQSGGSQITYYGSPEIGNTSFSGGSGIRKGN